MSLGCTNGIAIADAHELGHKRESLEKWLARIALAPSFYGHFMIEHNRGHHVRVSTPEDPASSRMGESFYRFLPRTVSGSLRSGWHLEASRLRRAGKSPFTLKNDLINAWAISVALWAVLLGLFGLSILPYLVLQAVIAFSLLEVVNYIEHYGLLRQTMEDGRYARCQPEHSWNANLVASNVFLYHLQRHSDHHAHPLRRYQVLRHFDDAPNLPTGYAGMIVLATIPPLYFRVMNPRVLEHYNGDVTKANINPPARARILRKYGKGGASTRRRRPRSRPVPLQTGPMAKYECPSAAASTTRKRRSREGFAPGTKIEEFPPDWTCPDCGVRDAVDYVKVEDAPAG